MKRGWYTELEEVWFIVVSCSLLINDIKCK